MKVLFVVNECNPGWASVPLLSYNLYHALSRRVDITLVTHERNRQALEAVRGNRTIHYISESRMTTRYYRHMNRVIFSRWNNWPVHHVLSYPVYAEFNQKVFRRFKDEVASGRYDIIHAMTPILPRYPYKIGRRCGNTPFILGPVNGGLPFPKNFEHVAKKEAARFNFLRYFARLQPGYKASYRHANTVLAGSSHTMELLQEMFSVHPPKLELFFENGIPSEFLAPDSGRGKRAESNRLRLLFVGRLVPYKGADMLIAALGAMDRNIKKSFCLTVVGDGPEKIRLQRLVSDLHLEEQVHFAGWVAQAKTLEYYRSADVFCFPSVREFGGAVVLEAMAAGLPCIVANYGGISEYVTPDTGFRIEPLSREHLIREIKDKVVRLLNDAKLCQTLGKKAALRAEEFEWGRKAERMTAIYRRALG